MTATLKILQELRCSEFIVLANATGTTEARAQCNHCHCVELAEAWPCRFVVGVQIVKGRHFFFFNILFTIKIWRNRVNALLVNSE